MTQRSPWSLHLLAASIAAIGTPAGLLANPQGAQVLQGTATLTEKDKTLTVTTSNGAVINWQQFNIGVGETTRFVQPSSSSQVLNRVLGGNPSQILGSLQSNGQVFLINPNGIAFGKGAQVDVGALVISTLKLSNDDLKAGRLNFGGVGAGQNGLNGSSLPGAIKNEGAIRTAPGGFVYLVAPQIENSGLIHSPEGEVLLAAGHKVTLVNPRTPEVSWEVSAPTSNAVNLGEVVAKRIGVYGQAVKNAGLLQATTAVVGEDGRIVLKGQQRVEQTPSGRLIAQGRDALGRIKGGEIEISGTDQVSLQGRIEAVGTVSALATANTAAQVNTLSNPLGPTTALPPGFGPAGTGTGTGAGTAPATAPSTQGTATTASVPTRPRPPLNGGVLEVTGTGRRSEPGGQALEDAGLQGLHEGFMPGGAAGLADSAIDTGSGIHADLAAGAAAFGAPGTGPNGASPYTLGPLRPRLSGAATPGAAPAPEPRPDAPRPGQTRATPWQAAPPAQAGACASSGARSPWARA